MTFNLNKSNSCAFCELKPKDDLSKNKDHFEISLCGNDTTLYVRETSVVDTSLKSLKDLLVEPAVLKDPSVAWATESTFSTSSEITGMESIQPGRSAVTLCSGRQPSKQLQHLYRKKWSGNTYFEEELRKIRQEEYSREFQDSMNMRLLWKQFQRELIKDKRRDMVKNSWPEWWQELSPKQICLATSLGDVIKADHEEGVTGRTRQWLLDMGVTCRLTPRLVRLCMKRSLLCPIDFLLEAHTVILKSQANVKKKRGDLERPFSNNERILLSAVCVLQLPTLLTMLHYILPPPEPYSTATHIQELLFGDLTDERVRYSTPYMEPLPFRSQRHFHEWAFDKVFVSLLPSILAADEDSALLPQATLSSLKLSVISQGKSLSDKTRSTKKFSESSITPSVSWLIARCLTKKVTESLLPGVDEVSEPQKYFSRGLNKPNMIQSKVQIYSIERDEYDVEVTIDTDPPELKIDTSPQLIQHKTSSVLDRKSIIKNLTAEADEKVRTPPLADSQMETLLENQRKDIFPKDLSDNIITPLNNEKNNNNIRKELNNDNLSEDGCKHGSGESQLQDVWAKIRDVPHEQQLQYAIKMLAEMGDPLAQLPRIHKLPTVQRWLEIRRGKNRILTKGAKRRLLKMSRRMWETGPSGASLKGPKVQCSKSEDEILTWDKKLWMQTEVKKAMDNYYSRIKQEKVDNARYFFPTMVNHYDHGSKLNRNFRNVFFTYLPSREADTFVYRPWKSHEIKNSKIM